MDTVMKMLPLLVSTFVTVTVTVTVTVSVSVSLMLGRVLISMLAIWPICV